MHLLGRRNAVADHRPGGEPGPGGPNGRAPPRPPIRIDSRGAILVVAGFVLATRYPARAVPFILLWTLGRGRLRSRCSWPPAGRPSASSCPLTVVFTAIPAAMLLGTAIEPGALLAMTSGFTMLPVAVPLFLAWSRRVRTAWLLTYAVVFGGVTIVIGLRPP